MVTWVKLGYPNSYMVNTWNLRSGTFIKPLPFPLLRHNLWGSGVLDFFQRQFSDSAGNRHEQAVAKDFGSILPIHPSDWVPFLSRGATLVCPALFCTSLPCRCLFSSRAPKAFAGSSSDSYLEVEVGFFNGSWISWWEKLIQHYLWSRWGLHTERKWKQLLCLISTLVLPGVFRLGLDDMPNKFWNEAQLVLWPQDDPQETCQQNASIKFATVFKPWKNRAWPSSEALQIVASP